MLTAMFEFRSSVSSIKREIVKKTSRIEHKLVHACCRMNLSLMNVRLAGLDATYS